MSIRDLKFPGLPGATGVDATPIPRHQTKKGSPLAPFLFSYLSSAAYFDFSSFNFAIRVGKTSL